MVVKAKVGRKRYILFETNEEIKMEDFIKEIRKFKEINPWVIYLKNKIGILRVRHLFKEKAINILNSMNKINGKDIKIRTIKTSGTIKSLREYLNERILLSKS